DISEYTIQYSDVTNTYDILRNGEHDLVKNIEKLQFLSNVVDVSVNHEVAINQFNPVLGGPTSKTIGEDTNVGATILTVTATDADDNSVFGAPKFSISGGADAAKFSIDADTGALKLAQKLDFETQVNYVVQVIATQGSTVSSPETITITATDANDGIVDG